MCDCPAYLERLAADKRAYADRIETGAPGQRSRSMAEVGRRNATSLTYAARKLREHATDQGDVADDGGDDDPWAAA